jgi:hypothetical protein
MPYPSGNAGIDTKVLTAECQRQVAQAVAASQVDLNRGRSCILFDGARCRGERRSLHGPIPDGADRAEIASQRHHADDHLCERRMKLDWIIVVTIRGVSSGDRAAHPGRSERLGLIAAVRARCAELHTTYETIDYVAGLPLRYTGKILSPSQDRHLGAISMGPLLGVLGLKLIVVVDEAEFERICARVTVRKIKRRRDTGGTILADKKRGTAGIRGQSACRSAASPSVDPLLPVQRSMRSEPSQ